MQNNTNKFGRRTLFLRKLAMVLSLAALCTAAQWLMAQGRGGQASAPAAEPARGQRGGNTQRDLLYAAVPGRVDDIGFGGIGLVVFDAGRNFRFVKRIPTWDYPAAQSPENVKGVAVSPSLGMIYVSTIKRLAAWDLLTEKKVWEQTYDGECCDRMALSPDGRTMYVPSFEGMHWYVVDAKTGDLIKKLPVPASPGAHNTIWSLDGSKVFMAGVWSHPQPHIRAHDKTAVRTVGHGFSPAA